NFYICYQFDKNEQKVCMLPEEDEIDQNIFDTANFVLIIVVDYMQGFFKTRRKHTKIPPPDPQNQQQDPRYLTDVLSYYLGKKFSLSAGQSGLSVYISDGEIKIVYKYNADIENILDLAQIIVQQLQQDQNGNRKNPIEEDEPEDAEI
ncbi:9676_t:CDS:1, partial [Racocetra persica]